MASLINDLGGPDGFGTNSLSRNDDSSSAAIDITSIFPQGINLFGHLYQTIYINNNGNITFTGPLSTYTPSSIGTGFTAPIIAPYWADVDTRGGPVTPTGGNTAGTNLVWYDLDMPSHTITVTWDDVGYYNQATNKVNAFQLQLAALPNGVAEIRFIYQDVTWVTGSLSGGSNGLGGTPARIGYSSGQGTYYEIPESNQQAALLSLPVTDGNTGLPGIFEFVSGGNGIYSFALPSVTTASGNLPETIDFGNVHVGDASQSILTITNKAAAPAEGLDASVTSSGASTATGTVTRIAAGSSNNTSLKVGLQTGTDGLKSGTVTVGLASDGQGTSGGGITTLPSQTIAVTGTVYAYAAPVFDRTVINLAARAGAPVSTATVTLSDGTVTDPYQEGLLYSIGPVPAAYTLSSPTSGTLATGSKTTLTFAAANTAAGTVSNQTISVGLTSTGTGTSGLGNTVLPSQTLTLNQLVYASAVAALQQGAVEKACAVGARVSRRR